MNNEWEKLQNALHLDEKAKVIYPEYRGTGNPGPFESFCDPVFRSSIDFLLL